MRKRVTYDGDVKADIYDDQIGLLAQIRKLKRKKPLFPNQEQGGDLVVDALTCLAVLVVMVVGLPQSGKTGIILSSIEKFVEVSEIPNKNIFVLTGLADVEWKEQTTDRLPTDINVFHRVNLLKEFKNAVEGKTNLLIFIDEINIAAKETQTIRKTLEKCGFLDKNELYERDIKIVQLSATPDGLIYDLVKWERDTYKIIYTKPGEKYLSPFNLLDQKRVFQYKDLCGIDAEGKRDNTVLKNIREIQEQIEKRFDKPLYHLIRTKTGDNHQTTIDNFKEVFGTDDYNYESYIGGTKVKDINSILSTKPKKNTFIFLKEKCRISKTWEQSFIGIAYDRFTQNPNDSTVLQSFVSRLSGYTNNGISICFTNIATVEKFRELWMTKYSSTLRWTSSTTTFRNNETKSKNSYNNPKLYGDVSESDDAYDDDEPIVEWFETQEDLKYFLMVMGWKRYDTKVPNVDGFYEAVIRDETKVFTTTEIIRSRKAGLNKDKTNFRAYACYDDITNKDTLKWCVIFKPRD